MDIGACGRQISFHTVLTGLVSVTSKSVICELDTDRRITSFHIRFSNRETDGLNTFLNMGKRYEQDIQRRPFINYACDIRTDILASSA